MIVSCSYRTDAIYALDSLTNYLQRHRDVEGVVFWTRDPRALIDHHAFELVRGIPCMVHISITPYEGVGLERDNPSTWQTVTAVKELSVALGPERVIWRYDPIILHRPTNTRVPLDIGWHADEINNIASRLQGRVAHCVTSILQSYSHAIRRMAEVREEIDFRPSEQRITQALLTVRQMTERYDIPLRYCGPLPGIGGARAEEILTDLDIPPAHCVDAAAFDLEHVPAHLRQGCTCDASVDVGAYDTCKHGCLFCYANTL